MTEFPNQASTARAELRGGNPMGGQIRWQFFARKVFDSVSYRDLPFTNLKSPRGQLSKTSDNDYFDALFDIFFN